MSVYVFDANVVISAALSPDGTGRRALILARSRGTIALSEGVFHEITEVLARPKFAAVLSKDRRNEVLEFLTAAAMWVFPAGEIQDCRDAKDNCYLDLALAAGASTIVSGDEDLLVLNPWRGIHVVRPAEFLALNS